MRFLLLLLMSLIVRFAGASHLVGGELHYEFLGENTYKLTLTLYHDCTSATEFDSPATIAIYNGTSLFSKVLMDYDGLTQVPFTSSLPCITQPESLCLNKAVYSETISLDPNYDYTVVYQRCCRQEELTNVASPDEEGTSITTHIPANIQNSSAVFQHYPNVMACVNDMFQFDASAGDGDGDLLSYSFYAPFTGASQSSPQPNTPSPPPFNTVTFANGYDATHALGYDAILAINPTTGMVTAKPNAVGLYLVGICVKEYRNGTLINTQFQEVEFNVFDCSKLEFLYSDTNVCLTAGEPLQLEVHTTGNVLWSPAEYFSAPTSPIPLVTLDTTTLLTVTATDSSGCVEQDTIIAKVVYNSELQLTASPPLVTVPGDTTVVLTVYNAADPHWLIDSTSVPTDTITVYPTQTTTYYCRESGADCAAQDSIVIKVIPRLKIRIYIVPNPVGNELTFVTFGGKSPVVQIYDVFGRVMHTAPLAGYTHTIDVSNFVDGIYIVGARINELWVHERFLKVTR